MLHPLQIARSGSEHANQAAFFAAAAVARHHGFVETRKWIDDPAYKLVPPDPDADTLDAVPELAWLHAIPNGGSRGDTARSRAIQGARMKAEGARSGVFDIFWPLPRALYHGLYIELKTPTGKLSHQQEAFRAHCVRHNYATYVARSWQEAFDAIEQYHSLRLFLDRD